MELQTSVLNELNRIHDTDANQRKKKHSDVWREKARLVPQGGYYNNLPIKYKKLKEVHYTDAINSDRSIKKGFCIKTELGEFYTSSLDEIPTGSIWTYHKIMPRMGTYFRRLKEDISHTVTRNPLIHPNKIENNC